MIIADIVKIALPAILAFVIGIGITPLISDFLYKNKMWKKKSGKVDFSGAETVIFNSLHREKEINTPRMGGLIIWISVLIATILVWALSIIMESDLTLKLDFLSRNQTWLPIFT